jgi:hypothetical protein
MRFGSGEHLVDGKDAVEVPRRDPALLVDELAADQRDLRDRPTPREQAETQEPQEEPRQWLAGRGRLAQRAGP